MVVFDSTFLSAVLGLSKFSPQDPDTNEPVDRYKERIDHLLSELNGQGTKIVVPAPVLSELLVRSPVSNPEWLIKINESRNFVVAPFDQKCAVELADMTRGWEAKTGRKRGDQDGSWAKVKFDRQIIAIAKVAGADIIYSDDKEIGKLGVRVGVKVISIANLPLPPERMQDRQYEIFGDPDS